MRRVVITGLGVVTPIGNDLEAMWSGLVAGTSGAAATTRFDAGAFATTFSCEVKRWEPSPWIDKREVKHVDLFLQFGIAAAMMAMADAGLGAKVPAGQDKRWGSYMGSTFGGITTVEDTHTAVQAKGQRHGFSPYYVTDNITNELPGMVSIRTGARGPNFAFASACATGANSIGEAMRAIRHGYADGMIAGGAEAPIACTGVGGFAATGLLSTRNAEPQRASRPFDRDRDGFVLGEGAGVLVLEELEAAKRRGARIYAELAGYGVTSSAHRAAELDREGAEASMRLALADAQLEPGQIGYINAHGTSSRDGDQHETAATKAVFGDHAKRLAMSSTKSMMGHTLGAAGAIEAAIAALAVTRGVLPPTINLDAPGPDCDLDYIPNAARELRVDAAMSNSFAFGGHNVSLIVRRYAGD